MHGTKNLSRTAQAFLFLYGIARRVIAVPNSSTLRARIEANRAQTRAGIESSKFAPFSRRATAREHYAEGGWAAERITSHLDAHLTHPPIKQTYFSTPA